ncbi:polysaccharide biosynthesis protein [Nocardioidaceae bacterium]|nr:polysaccharide biosynthesis protein [Nocardioidaceae bacterium]
MPARPAPPSLAAVRRWLVGGSAIAAAIAVMNLTTYGFTVLAARFLGPEEYGQLGSLMGLLLVLSVVSLGLQATAARRLAAHPEQAAPLESAVVRATWRAAALLGVALLVVSPLVERLLRLETPLSAVLLAAAAVPLTVMGGQAGLLQGEKRWAPLSFLYVAAGTGRLVLGLGGVALTGTTAGAMAGVALGGLAPVAVGWWGLRARQPREADAAPSGEPPATREVLVEITQSSHALLAFFVLSNLDVVIARAVLDDRLSGLYAAGLIMTKAVLFLPQFVVVVVFPSLTDAASRRRLFLPALTAVLGIGVVTTLGVLALPGLAVTFVGGGAYDDLRGLLWLFAALGTVLAMLQLIVYQVLAQRSHRRVLLIWAAVAVLTPAAALTAGGVTGLVALVTGVDVALLALLVVLVVRADAPPRGGEHGRVRAPAAPEPEPAPAAPRSSEE